MVEFTGTKAIDFSTYPDGTAELFCALSKHVGILGDGATRSELATWSGLSKSQARYRLDLLCDDGAVEEQTFQEGGNRVRRYRVVTDHNLAKENALHCEELLGEIPEEINSKQLMELIDEMRIMRNQLDNLKDIVMSR